MLKLFRLMLLCPGPPGSARLHAPHMSMVSPSSKKMPSTVYGRRPGEEQATLSENGRAGTKDPQSASKIKFDMQLMDSGCDRFSGHCNTCSGQCFGRSMCSR